MDRVRTADGLELPVWVAGRGPALILLHGFTGDGEHDWIDTGAAARLIDAGYRVAVPDLRGHGRADAPHDPSAYEPRRWGNDVAAVLELLDEPAAVVGYSMGARVAARAALDLDGITATVLGGMGHRLLDPHWVAPADQLLAYGAPSATAIGAPGPRRERERVERRGLDPAALHAICTVNRWVPAEELATLSVPCLVVKGRADTMNGDHERLAAVIPEAESAHVPGDHWTALADPPLTELIDDFMTRRNPR